MGNCLDQSWQRRRHQRLNKAIELKENKAAAGSNLGSAKYELGQDKAIKLKKNKAAGLIERGWVYFRLNQYGKAIEDFNKALELDPEDENAARGLLASERQISLTEAINKLKKETKSDVDTLIGNADKLEKREKKPVARTKFVG